MTGKFKKLRKESKKALSIIELPGGLPGIGEKRLCTEDMYPTLNKTFL